MLAVCGGYQLLGRFYRDRSGTEQPGAGVLPIHTIAGDRRLIGDVLIECELEPGERQTVVGFENHAGRTILDEGAQPLGRVVAGFGNDGRVRLRRMPPRQCDRHVSPRAAAAAKSAAGGLAARARGRACHGRAARRSSPFPTSSSARPMPSPAPGRGHAGDGCSVLYRPEAFDPLTERPWDEGLGAT